MKDKSNKKGFNIIGIIILAIGIFITTQNIIIAISKNILLTDLKPPLHESSDVEVITKQPNHLDFDENSIPIKLGNLQDGKNITAYRLPIFDKSQGEVLKQLSLLAFSDSSVLYCENSEIVKENYRGDIMLYNVKSNERQKVLELAKLREISNIEYHMNEQYVVISLDTDLFIFDRQANTGTTLSSAQILSKTKTAPVSVKLHANTLYLLTDTDISTYDISQKTFTNSFNIESVEGNHTILGVSSEYIILESKLSNAPFKTGYTFITQNDGKTYSSTYEEGVNISSILEFEDKILLQGTEKTLPSISFNKKTCEITNSNELDYYMNRLTSSFNTFGMEATLDEYENADGYNLVDLKTGEKAPLSINCLDEFISNETIYVKSNSILLSLSASDYFSTSDETYLIIIE